MHCSDDGSQLWLSISKFTSDYGIRERGWLKTHEMQAAKKKSANSKEKIFYVPQKLEEKKWHMPVILNLKY